MSDFNEHYDDEGYHAVMMSDEPEELQEFEDWLDQQGIPHERDAGEEDEPDAVWVRGLTDKPKAILVKLRYGGR